MVELPDTWRCIWCEALIDQDRDTCEDCSKKVKTLTDWIEENEH
jgi:hypothetical protein